MRRPSKRAFTLVELLLIIIIIALLAGLILPSVALALAIGKRVSCANNLREVARGCITYASELRFTRGSKVQHALPTASGIDTTNWADPANGNRKALYVLIATKFVAPNVFICPGVGAPSSGLAPVATNGSFGLRNCDYSYQSMVVDQGNPALGLGVIDSLRASPSMVILADKNPRIQLFATPLSIGPPMDAVNFMNSPNHAKLGQVVGSLDGSAKWTDRPFVEPVWQPADPNQHREYDFIYQSDDPSKDSNGKPDAGNGVSEAQYKDIFLIP